MEVESQVLLQKEYLKGTKSHLPCAFGGARAGKNFSVIRRCWYNLSYYTTSYTTTCVTFIDRFTIWKEKSSVLIKLGGGVLFPFFLFFKQTVVQTKFCLLTQQMRHRHGCGLEKPFWADSARSGSFHALRSAWSVHHTSFGVTTELIPWSFALWFFFFIHLHHLHLPLHLTGTYKAGSVGSGQAISLPSAWPRGGSAAENSSAWLPAHPLRSHSSPATPWAVSLAVPHYLAFRGM